MSWEKASPTLTEVLEEALTPFACQRRTMFGGPAYFVNGNLFTGVHECVIILRLDGPDREAIMASHDEVRPFAPMGRPMREYVAVPEGIAMPPDALREWVGRSHAFAASLPPKPPKEKKGA